MEKETKHIDSGGVIPQVFIFNLGYIEVYFKLNINLRRTSNMKNYAPKLVLCRLKTGGRTLEQTKEEEFNGHASLDELTFTKKFNDEIDGVEAILSLWDYDNYKYYHLSSWDKQYEDKIIKAMFYAENTMSSIYRNDFERFKNDWQTELYIPECPIVFEKKHIEEIRVIREEIK